MNTASLISLALALILSVATAALPSTGSVRAADTRSQLKPSDFVIDPTKGNILTTPTFIARIADVSKFPALGAVDVQTQFVLITLNPGQDFVRHYHPRGTEYLFVLNGRMNVSFTDEGLAPKPIYNVVRWRQGTVFPQGLFHTTRCISSIKCQFVTIFNSADPGLVPV